LASKTYDKLITERPFRSPHHSSSHISIVGGGNNARPGEVSLSHRGVLLLDEIPEFDRLTLEALRQPLEDKVITVARSKATVEYPADFLLVATANPCPCGYYGSDHPCQCSPYQVISYRRKLSGPILDRIDLFVTVSSIDHKLLLQTPRTGADDDRKAVQRILLARQSQQQRTGQTLNARMTNDEVKNCTLIGAPATHLLNEGAKRLELSPRAYMRTIKVARTIADLECSKNIDVTHITEALQYRSMPVDYSV
jgi:magnesium chelatase family protein